MSLKRIKLKKTRSKARFVEHLQELRSCFFRFFLFFLVGSVIGFMIRDRILLVLLKPLSQTLYYTSPSGGISLAFGLSIFFGFIISIPTLLVQILRFVEPAIPHKTRLPIFLLMILSCGLMMMGMVFAYYISLPTALLFLGEFSFDQVKSLISTNEYFSFVTKYLLGVGVLFELPLIVMFINKMKPLKVGQLMKFQREVIAGSFVIAAVVTPTPDVLNQAIMAIPIIILYEISILIIWIINKSRKSVLNVGLA